MISNRFSFVSSAALVLTLAGPVHAASTADAQDPTPATSTPDDPDDVAMTAGTGVSGVTGLGGLQPTLSAGLEGRLFDYLWLMGRALGGFAEGPGYDVWTAGGALGPRIVFNPRDRIQASTFLLVGASYSSFEADETDVEELVGEGEAGLTVDIGIISGVGLRLSSTLVQLSRRFESEADPSTSLQFGPRPEILLRVSF